MTSTLTAKHTAVRYFFIRSSTNRDLFYRVIVNPSGSMACPCPARTARCRHIEQVERGCGLEAKPKARRPLSQETIDWIASLELA